MYSIAGRSAHVVTVKLTFKFKRKLVADCVFTHWTDLIKHETNQKKVLLETHIIESSEVAGASICSFNKPLSQVLQNSPVFHVTDCSSYPLLPCLLPPVCRDRGRILYQTTSSDTHASRYSKMLPTAHCRLRAPPPIISMRNSCDESSLNLTICSSVS